MKIEKEQFKDVKFMTQQEKYMIAKHFKRFVENGFQEKDFVDRVYTHIHTHNGFIAHYNRNGFYHEYFSGSNDDLKRFVEKMVNLEYFEGEIWGGKYNSYIDCGDYKDLNKVLADILIENNIPIKVIKNE